jgi:hypothetical protein
MSVLSLCLPACSSKVFMKEEKYLKGQLTNSLIMKKEKVNTIHILTLKSIINSLVSVYIKKKKILQEVLSQRNKELRMKAE